MDERLYYTDTMPSKVEFLLNKDSLFSEVLEAREISNSKFIKNNKDLLNSNNYNVKTNVYIDSLDSDKVFIFHNVIDEFKNVVPIYSLSLK